MFSESIVELNRGREGERERERRLWFRRCCLLRYEVACVRMGTTTFPNLRPVNVTAKLNTLVAVASSKKFPSF